MPLRDAIRSRRSVRQYSTRRFDLQSGEDLQLLSDLLWSAWGYISAKRRSAPSSHNRQETDLYVLLPEGAYLYDAQENSLHAVSRADLRAASGAQDYVGTAAAELVFAARTGAVTGKTPRGIVETIYADTGFISQNIYLFCASEHLGTVVRAMVPKESLSRQLALAPDCEITLVQTVGWQEAH